MSYDTGLRMLGLQAAEQSQQCPLLARRARVGRIAVAVEASLIAYAQRVCVVALRMGPDELLMPRLVCPPAAGDVVVVAREPEPVAMAPYQRRHRKCPVAPRRRAVHHDKIYPTHDCTKNELTTAVSTVMINWMMVFQRLKFLIITDVF